MPTSFYINTYGCQMNVHESEKIAGVLLSRGLKRCDVMSQADIVVYNTCCVRETAETKVYGHLGKAKVLKTLNPHVKIIVCGCMPQQDGAAEKLKRKFPFIDLIIGTHNLGELDRYLDELDRRGPFYEVWESERDIPEVSAARVEGIKAFVNIMYGCDNFCSYCIVPYVRGRERSRDFDTVVAEVNALINKGYKEITLLGQNVNSYRDKRSGRDFAALLTALGQLKTKYRLKFMTSHPKDLTEDIVKAMVSSPNIAKYVHLPVQAGNNRILELMNRRYTREQYLSKIAMIRAFMPDAGLSTDVMVGFPSETEEEFLESLRLIEDVRFNNIFTFIYNRRSGTAADKMEQQLDRVVKSDRIERLIARQAQIGMTLAAECIGKTYEVLCESVTGGVCKGKTETDFPVSFKADGCAVGDFIQVKITGSKNTLLYGEAFNG